MGEEKHQERCMTLATTARLSTPEDLLTLPEYGRYELLDGRLVERHTGARASYVATQALGLIGSFVQRHRLGLVFHAACGYQIFAEAPNRVRFAAGSFIRRGRLPDDLPPPGHCCLTPDLVIEAVSPNDTASALEEKISQWLAAGVPLAWVLYPETRHIQVHRADGTVTKLQEGGHLLGEEVLPGFQCDVAAVFRGL
jgi:Uma2 family endonuclease